MKKVLLPCLAGIIVCIGCSNEAPSKNSIAGACHWSADKYHCYVWKGDTAAGTVESIDAIAGVVGDSLVDVCSIDKNDTVKKVSLWKPVKLYMSAKVFDDPDLRVFRDSYGKMYSIKFREPVGEDKSAYSKQGK